MPIATLMLSGVLAGPPPAEANPDRVRPRLHVTRPPRPVNIADGDKLRLSWRIEEFPEHPEQWTVRVILKGCREATGSRLLHERPLRSATGSFTWRVDHRVVHERTLEEEEMQLDF